MATLIPGKNLALQMVQRPNPDLSQLRVELLQDKDLILSYAQAHSSNPLLLKGHPININKPGLIDDADFIVKIIQYLDLDYNKKALLDILKASTVAIIKIKMNKESISVEESKELAKNILKKYDNAVSAKNEQLARKGSDIDEVCRFIEETPINSLAGAENEHNTDSYNKRRRIGFC